MTYDRKNEMSDSVSWNLLAVASHYNTVWKCDSDFYQHIVKHVHTYYYAQNGW